MDFQERAKEFLNSNDIKPHFDIATRHWLEIQLARLLKESHKLNDTIDWFPADLSPKDETIVLGEDAEGCPYIVKFLKGDTPRPCNDDECSHPDHHEEESDGTCRSIGEGFYETLEQLGNEREYVRLCREIVHWRPIPKSS